MHGNMKIKFICLCVCEWGKRAHVIHVIINCIYRTGYQFTFSFNRMVVAWDTNGTKFQLLESKINEANCTKKKLI